MSVSSEVRRTLVKSPPELWAELSDPLALARHLDELGEIRITGTIPERIVDWEAASAHGAETIGRIEIEPSGWGTRVTLSASRQTPSTPPEPAGGAVAESAPTPEPQPALAPATPSELMPAPEPELQAAPEIATSQPIPETAASQAATDASPQPAPEAASQPAPSSQPETTLESSPAFDTEIVASEPLKTFWTRLFRRRARSQPERSIELQAPIEAESSTHPEPDATTGEPAPAVEELATPEPQPAPEPRELAAETAPAAEEPQPAPAPDIAAELAELEQQTTAVLTGVLDRLGAAHHRPFSRA